MIIRKIDWAPHYPGASVGILVMKEIVNLSTDDRLNRDKRELEESLRKNYAHLSRNELKAVHPIDAYVTYYKKFGNNYHVLHQLESVVKGKSIPTVSSLVEAMFMAELKNMLLTAGHDLEKVNLPLDCDISSGTERYTAINGKEVTTVQGDMIIGDAEGIISSILRGPDLKTRIGPDTRKVLFTVYAPPGIKEAMVSKHLGDIESFIRIFSGHAVTDTKQVYTA